MEQRCSLIGDAKVLPLHPYPYHHTTIQKIRRGNPQFHIKAYPGKVFMRLCGHDVVPFKWTLTSRGPSVEVVDYELLLNCRVPDNYDAPDFFKSRLLLDYHSLLALLYRQRKLQHYWYYKLEYTEVDLVLHMLTRHDSVSIREPRPSLRSAVIRKFGKQLVYRRDGDTVNIQRNI